MYELTTTKQNTIDDQLQGKLDWAENNKLQAEQMALDATRLLSCTSDRLEAYQNQGFFKRCWCSLSHTNAKMQRANQHDLVSMQQYAWRYINLLNERNILLAHSMITVKNNLMTLAVTEKETRNEVRRMAEKVYERFVVLEDRMKAVEVSTSIHGWLLTLDTRDYDERYTPHFRLLRVVNDFMGLKSGNWNPQELRYLQKAIKEVDLPWKSSISVELFVDGMIDEIESAGYNNFEELLGNNNGDNVPVSFILENVAVPTYTSLFSIADNYTKSSNTIDVLIEQLSCTRIEAIKKVLLSFIAKQGVDVTVEVPLRDLAIELLGCMRLSQELFDSSKKSSNSTSQENNTQVEKTKSENVQLVELATEARSLLPEWTKFIGMGIAGAVLEETSDLIDSYIENNSMEIKELASYFSAEDIAESLQEGIDKAEADIIKPMTEDIIKDEPALAASSTALINGFRLATDEAIKPFLKSIVIVEVAGASLLNKQPSVLATGAKGVGIGLVAGTLLGPVGIVGVLAANYLHNKNKDKSFTNEAETFDSNVQASFEAYDHMRKSLQKAAGDLILSFMAQTIDDAEAKGDSNELKEAVSAMQEHLADSHSGEEDDRDSDNKNFIDSASLLDLLSTFEFEHYYVSGNIPNEKLANVQSFPVSPGHDVLALIDSTVFGSAKNGMAITSKGVYWHNGNGWLDTATETNHLTWSELKRAETSLEVSDDDLVLVPGSPFCMAASDMKPKDLRRVIKRCLKLIN